jgi:putative ABC transport system permease protein
MSGVGGLVGALLGIGTSLIIGYFASHASHSVIPVPIVDPVYVILSVTVSGLVGIVFGVYPAYRAAQLDPIEALRYE